MKNKMIFFSKWPSTRCLDAHLTKSLIGAVYIKINITQNVIVLRNKYFQCPVYQCICMLKTS